MDAGIQPNAFGDWAKLEGSRSELSDSQLCLLEQWHSSRDSNEIMSLINNIIPEFKKVHKSLCIALDLKEKKNGLKKY